jgi:glycerophosphoryl diester phosphodiesterase
MEILSHRGHWRARAERNTPAALARSFEGGFGTETDLRDLAGRLVVAHDPPGPEAPPAEELFALHARLGPALPLALNVKADGLQALVTAMLARFAVQDAFVFDMSIPDTVQWLKTEVPVFVRHSDVEPEPPLLDRASGVWLDGFAADWWEAATIRRHLDAGRRLCVVSPELHGRPHLPIWEKLAAAGLDAAEGLMLCTDHPTEARRLFGSEDRRLGLP